MLFIVNSNGVPSVASWVHLPAPYAEDGIPPTPPSGLTATATNSSAVSLTWTASTDNVGVTGYNILRNGVQVATSTTTSYTDTGLSENTQYTYTVVAHDAAGNISTPSNQASATTPVEQCPCSIWQDGTPTGTTESNDPNAQTLGVQFQPNTSGFITGVRFYKEPNDTGAHTGSLWSSTGQLLASGTFTNETASGWQELDFSSPVAVTAGTTYVASYFTPTGNPAGDPQGLATAVTNGPLTALAGGGVYVYGGTNTFPANTYNNNNYWVDVVYSPTSGATAPNQPTGVSATAGNGSATLSWTAPSNGGSAITSYTVTPYIGSAAQTPVTVSGSPPATQTTVTGLTNGTSYTFTVSATNGVGTGQPSAPSNAVTPSPPTVPGTPTGVSATAGNGSATVSWTAPSNGGSAITSYTVTPYIGSVAQAPVPVTGNPPATQTTVTGLTNGTSYTFTVSAANAVGTGPVSSASNAVTPSVPPSVTGVTPSSGASGVAVSVAPSATFSQAVTPSTVSFTLVDSAGNSVAGSVGFSGGNTVATFTPTNPLAVSTTYTATVSGAQNASGTPMSGPYSWSFTTVGPPCPCSVWNNGTPAGSVDANDTNPQTLGVQFTASSDGFIAGVRFYKETDNTGAHIGSLWSSTGTLLASGTFSNETASGWQELDFSAPVAVTAGTTYVASYFTSTGHYAATSAGLASAVTNGPLTALVGGGVYASGSSNTFPNNMYNDNNYWVDVVYSQSAGATAPVVTTESPSSGSTGVAASVAPTATFSQPVTPGTVSFTMTGPGGSSVAGSVSFNAADTVATFTPSSSLSGSTTYTATVSGAQNASGTPMASPFSWSFTTGAVASCPCSIWQDGTPTGSIDSNDPNAQTLGVQFQAASSGFITGVRFYKEPEDTGAHIGSLWSSTGTLLASGTFSNETASGWQELDFSSSVAVTAGTTYVASYFTPTGYPASTPAGLASAVTNGPLTALAGGGVYAYGGANTFPANVYNNNNYWVDVVYSHSSGATAPGAPTGVSATAGNASATVSWAAPGSGGSAITSYTVTPYIGSVAQTPVTVSGNPPATQTTVTGLTNGTSYTFTVSATNAVGTGPSSSPSNAVTPAVPPTVTSVTPSSGATGVAASVAPTATFSQAVTPSTASFTVVDSGGNSVAGSVSFNAADTVATFTPTNPLASSVTYTATVSGAQNASGTAMSSPYSWSFTTAGPACPCSIWQNGTPTGTSESNDPNPQTLGVQFTASSNGFISGVRFYKEADDTGAHIGSLWSSTGTLLASGTFTGETASGWQELDFSAPVAVTAGTTYVASYFTHTGYPAGDPQGLASAVTNGPLTALAGGGVYVYGSSNTFPANTYHNNNYWVDVVYSPSAGTTAPVVTTVTPSAGSTGNAVSVAPSATFSQPVTPSTVSFTVTGSGGSNVAGSVSFNAADTVATFTPTSALSGSTTYTATVSGAQNASGTPMASPFSWSFTTGAVAQCPCSIWQDGTPTGSFESSDPNAQTLGVQFQASSSGYIAGVRFYKEPDNSGAHVGSLWSSSGALLASGTFTGETASGWQELDFSAPVAVTAGTTYVASYFTSTGYPAGDPGGLASAVTNGPLTALAGGGVYAYGGSNTFPTNTYNNNNYWVDVVYSPSAGATPPVVSTVSPGPGSTGNTVSVAAPATFSQPVTPGTVSFTVKDSGGNPVAGTVGFNAADTVATFTPSSALVGSTTYTATVSGAQNASGTPMSSPFSWNFTTAATQPGAPTGVSATAGNGSATVSWTAPGSGGSAITSYTVTPYKGSAAQTPTTVSGSPPATSITVTGLTNGTSYTFTVSATNAVGTGPASSPSAAVTPAPPPSVTGVTPSSGSTGNAVSVSASATFSQAVVPSTVSFTVKDPAGNSVVGTLGFNAADTVATFTPVSSLAGKTTYTATVSGAQNASGTPMSSPFSWSFTTAATPPGAPTGVSATAGSKSAKVSWTAPSNGGSAITKYTVTPYIGSTPQKTVTVSGSPPATSVTVTGLTTGTTYTFKVSATNAVGTGAASSPSNAVAAR
jgi:hypothetical protein